MNVAFKDYRVGVHTESDDLTQRLAQRLARRVMIQNATTCTFVVPPGVTWRLITLEATGTPSSSYVTNRAAQVSVQDELVHVIWETQSDWIPRNSGGVRIFWTISGQTFEPAMGVGPLARWQYAMPELLLKAGSTVFVAMSDFVAGNTVQLTVDEVATT